MAGTIVLNSTANFVTYLNTKATKASTGINIHPKEITAYRINDTTIRLPYVWGFEITLPAKESDALANSEQTFRYLNAYHLPIKVTYSGNAIA